MASKRMFDKAIIDTDKFTDMPMSTKALYFLLGMEADDHGFVSPRRVMRVHGGGDDDLKILIAKGFLIYFETGVIVITDWHRHNKIRKERIKPTEYQNELLQLAQNDGKYCLSTVGQITDNQLTVDRQLIKAENVENVDFVDNTSTFGDCRTNVRQMSAEIRLEEVRLDKVSIKEKSKKKPFIDEVKDMFIVYTQNPDVLQALNDFLEMRMSMPAKDRFKTKQAVTMFLNKLDKLSSIDAEKIEMLENATISNWKTVYELNKSQSNGRMNFAKPSRSEPIPHWLNNQELNSDPQQDIDARLRIEEMKKQMTGAFRDE